MRPKSFLSWGNGQHVDSYSVVATARSTAAPAAPTGELTDTSLILFFILSFVAF
ncbi:MAG: hypothetical protein M1587_04610 [Thaumarchaeota archaeon]|nr:hypothetical protein [Nitrososphaerota archaeon]